MLKVIIVPAVCRQFVAIICCLTMPFTFSMLYGWPMINLIDLQDANSTLPMGPLSSQETTVIISILNIGALIGNFGVLPIIYLMGPKKTIHMFAIPIILSCLLIIWTQNVYYLYASRLLAGMVGGGLPVAIPTLIQEICFDNVRGAFSSLYDTSLNSGLILSFYLGNNLHTLEQAKIYLLVPSIFIVVLFLLPESPVFLKIHGKKHEASKSLKFYKGTDREETESYPQQQLDTMEKSKIKCMTSDSSDSKLVLKDFLTPQAKQASFIAFTAYILCFLCGNMAVLNYVTEIFTKTGSLLSIKNSSFLVSIATLIGNIVFFTVVEHFNRRTFYISSTIMTALSYFLLGIYCWLLPEPQPEYEWIPTFLLPCLTFVSCMGLMPIPYIIAIEIFPKKIRSVCLAISLAIMWIILFITCAVFPILLENIGLSSCMIIFGAMCSLNSLFGIWFVPETRGKSYEEIMQILTKLTLNRSILEARI